MRILISELQYNGIIQEIKGINEVYHFTDNAERILFLNRINLSSILGSDIDMISNNDKMFYLSLSRTGSFKSGYGFGFKTRIAFDGNKLRQRYKIIPFDYWRTHNKKEFEYEDRLVTDNPIIDDINKYILRIDVITDGKFFEKDRILNKLCIKRGIDLHFYRSEKDLKLGNEEDKSIIDDEPVNNVNFDKAVSTENEKIYDTLIDYIITALIYDKSDIGNSDIICSKLSKLIEMYNLPMTPCDEIIELLNRMNNDRDNFIDNFESELRFYFKSGSGGKIREYIKLLIKEMRTNRVKTINELIKKKLDENIN